MADPLIFGEREIEFLKELVRQKVEFMIVGLSAAALQGAPVVTQAVDLWFKTLPDPGLEAVLKKLDGSYIPPIAGNPPMLAGDGVKLFDARRCRCFPWSVSSKARRRRDARRTRSS